MRRRVSPAPQLVFLSLLTTTASFASGLADPIVLPKVVVADNTASSGSLDSLMSALFIMLMIVNVVGAA